MYMRTEKCTLILSLFLLPISHLKLRFLVITQSFPQLLAEMSHTQSIMNSRGEIYSNEIPGPRNTLKVWISRSGFNQSYIWFHHFFHHIWLPLAILRCQSPSTSISREARHWHVVSFSVIPCSFPWENFTLRNGGKETQISGWSLRKNREGWSNFQHV